MQTSGFGPGPNGARLPLYDFSAIGYSLLGTVLAMSVGLVMIVLLVLNSVLRYFPDKTSGFERTGMNSSAVKALCRRLNDDDEAHLFPISVGVVEERDDISAFSRRLVFSTDTRMQYITEDPDIEGVFQRPFLKKSEDVNHSFADAYHQMAIKLAAWKACFVSQHEAQEARQAD
jgi:hypothetical protein